MVTLEHAKGWVKAGHNVTWLTAGYSGAARESTIEGVRIVRRAGSFTVYLYAWVYLILNARLVDVVVDQVHGIPFFSPLFTRKPVVVFIHEIAGEIWDVMFPFPINRIGKFLERWYFQLYRRCLFWTIAPSTLEELVARGIPRKNCVAIPNPLIVSDRKLLKARPKEAAPTYVFISRVVRMKGIEEVIKAFSFILQAQPDAQLWIIGGGETGYIVELRRMMGEYHIADHVTLYGRLLEEKKFERLSRAHILLHASVKEGWGLVVLEAAAVGTPAVVYNVSGLKDVVKDGKTGIVIRDNSPAEMAREAVKLQQDSVRYGSYQKNAKAWVDSLKWHDVVKKSLKILIHTTI